MSLGRKVARKKLRRAIATQMGTLGRKPLAAESHPDIQRMFHPHSERGPAAGYPLFQISHEFAKMPRETITNWVDPEKLMHTLRQNHVIAGLLMRNPQLERSFRESVMNAIRERGIKGTKFWVTAPKSYIDKIIAGGKANPNRMNIETGRIISAQFGTAAVPRTIVDIGTFAGGTIGSVVRALSPEQRRLLRVVLVDVAGNVVRNNAVPALVELGVERRNIRVIPTSFYNAAVAFRQMPKPLHERGERRFARDFVSLAGKVDAVVAGAATINFANDLRPYLRSIRALLKKGGVFVNWDWGSAEVRSPEIDVPESKKRVIGRTSDGRQITEHDANVSFFNFWLGFFNYPDSVKQRMFAEMESSRNFNFMGWCERNMAWMESERQKSGGTILPDPAGFRNRAYRLGSAMQEEAIRQGMEASEPIYPLAKPGERDTGNVNWMVVIRKQ